MMANNDDSLVIQVTKRQVFIPKQNPEQNTDFRIVSVVDPASKIGFSNFGTRVDNISEDGNFAKVTLRPNEFYQLSRCVQWNQETKKGEYENKRVIGQEIYDLWEQSRQKSMTEKGYRQAADKPAQNAVQPASQTVQAASAQTTQTAPAQNQNSDKPVFINQVPIANLSDSSDPKFSFVIFDDDWSKSGKTYFAVPKTNIFAARNQRGESVPGRMNVKLADAQNAAVRCFTRRGNGQFLELALPACEAAKMYETSRQTAMAKQRAAEQRSAPRAQTQAQTQVQTQTRGQTQAPAYPNDYASLQDADYALA